MQYAFVAALVILRMNAFETMKTESGISERTTQKIPECTVKPPKLNHCNF